MAPTDMNPTRKVYSAPLIPHKQMVWWYKEIHERVDDSADLIGEHTSFLDLFIIDTATRSAARLLRNRTIFKGDEDIDKIGRRGKNDYLPREVLLIELGMDFMYHEAARPQDTVPPFVQHRPILPFVHATYIILAESFLRTVSNYCGYVDKVAGIRSTMAPDVATPAPIMIDMSNTEVKASSIETKIRAERYALYGVVKQVQWHMVIVIYMRGMVLQSFRRLAMQLAKRYGRSEQQIQDNFQHGSTGLVRAANYFDPYREKAFSGLARNWVQASILLHLKSEANICKIPAPVWQIYRSMEQKAHDLGIKGDIGAIAKEMKMTPMEVYEIYRMIQINRPVSLENPVSDDDPTTILKDNIRDNSPSPETMVIGSMSDSPSDYMHHLSSIERMVVCCLFGAYDEILQEGPMSDEAIASERTRQVAAYIVQEASLGNL